jgi:hypothetical protein
MNYQRGRTDPLFAEDAIARLHEASLELPRIQQCRDGGAHCRGSAGKVLVDDKLRHEGRCRARA